MKLEVIFSAMRWDLGEIVPDIAVITPKKPTGSSTVRDSKVKVCQNTTKKVKTEDKLPQVIETKEVIEDKREELQAYYEE